MDAILLSYYIAQNFLLLIINKLYNNYNLFYYFVFLLRNIIVSLNYQFINH